MPSSMRFVLWLVFLIGGNVSLLAGLFLTRQAWRPDVAPYGRHISTWEITWHPERFATPEKVPIIRLLNRIGLLLLGAALAVVVYDIAAAGLR